MATTDSDRLGCPSTWKGRSSVDPVAVGRAIAAMRKDQGLTQRQLASAIGVTDKAVSRWERGLGVPDQSLLPSLASALRTDIEAILVGSCAGDANTKGWRGAMLLRYAEGLGPGTQLFGKCSVYLQVGYLMLAGIRRVDVVGEGGALIAARRLIEGQGDLGVEFRYLEAVPKAADPEVRGCGELGSEPRGRGGYDAERGAAAAGGQSRRGTMVVSGLDFLYGKDLSRALWRQMASCTVGTRLRSHGGAETSVCFLPGDHDPAALYRDIDTASLEPVTLERGIVAFPIRSLTDAQDAGNVVSAIERHADERVMDLRELARRRGYVNGPSVDWGGRVPQNTVDY